LSGEVPKAIQNNDFQLAKNIIEKYKNIFGEEDFYLEIQSNGIQEQNLVNNAIIKLYLRQNLTS
jgi:DNA polymerase-3 subunit alpha